MMYNEKTGKRTLRICTLTDKFCTETLDCQPHIENGVCNYLDTRIIKMVKTDKGAF